MDCLEIISQLQEGNITFTEAKKLASEVSCNVTPIDGMPYCMVRTYSAGVFAGYVEKLEGKIAALREARRIYYWKGAATLSELATRGTSCPTECKFPIAVDSVTLTEVIEIIPITSTAKATIASVPVWSC